MALVGTTGSLRRANWTTYTPPVAPAEAVAMGYTTLFRDVSFDSLAQIDMQNSRMGNFDLRLQLAWPILNIVGSWGTFPAQLPSLVNVQNGELVTTGTPPCTPVDCYNGNSGTNSLAVASACQSDDGTDWVGWLVPISSFIEFEAKYPVGLTGELMAGFIQPIESFMGQVTQTFENDICEDYGDGSIHSAVLRHSQTEGHGGFGSTTTHINDGNWHRWGCGRKTIAQNGPFGYIAHYYDGTPMMYNTDPYFPYFDWQYGSESDFSIGQVLYFNCPQFTECRYRNLRIWVQET